MCVTQMFPLIQNHPNDGIIICVSSMQIHVNTCILEIYVFLQKVYVITFVEMLINDVNMYYQKKKKLNTILNSQARIKRWQNSL